MAPNESPAVARPVYHRHPGVDPGDPSAGAAPVRIQLEGGFAEVNEKGLTVLAEKAVEA